MRIGGKRHRIVWHSGDGPGLHGLLLRMVDARVTVVLFFNSSEVEELLDEQQYRGVARLARAVGEIVLAS